MTELGLAVAVRNTMHVPVCLKDYSHRSLASKEVRYYDL